MDLLLKQYQALIQETPHSLSILANTTAFIKQNMDDVSWVGFYLVEDETLYLGPFQGPIACTTIPFFKGVCGACATQKQIIRVDNVHQFEGHIACDSQSQSEIVLPVFKNNQLYAILDLDSYRLAHFQDKEQDFLQSLVEILQDTLTSK